MMEEQMGEEQEGGKYFKTSNISGGICASSLEVVYPAGVYSGHDCFTIHQL
jgi:hypothetical protein